MKKQLIILVTLMATSLNIQAQKTPIEKYEIAPEDYEQVFLDIVHNNPYKTINEGHNEYVGQVDPLNNLYGYGTYITADGSQFFGKFRNGKMMFGITIGKEMALVGSTNYYASYSLTTGKLDFIFRVNEKVVVDAKFLTDYKFMRLKYANGDEYIGEIYKDKRHGYGVYYYANGDFWYGQYKDDFRYGFGAYFSSDGGLKIGQWGGEDELRVYDLIEVATTKEKKH